MSSTVQILRQANEVLQEKFEVGQPDHIGFDGRPEIHVSSLKPFLYERYGLYLNRGPHLAGQFVLRAFTWRQEEDTIFPLALFEANGTAIYGASISEQHVMEGLVSRALDTEVAFEPT